MLLKNYVSQINRYLFQCSNRIIKTHFTTEPKQIDETRYKLESSDIEKTIKQNPILASIPTDLWKKSHDIFINQGIKTNDFLKIMQLNPALITRPSKNIIKSIETWRSCQFGENRLHQLITSYPKLLDIENDSILRFKINFLKEYFGTAKNVWRIFMNSPNILNENHQIIRSKIEYLIHNMKLETSEICKSNVFDKSLNEIRCRHVFLDRLGIFKVKSNKADENQPSKNPRLHLIIDTNNTEFAIKICGVSLEEYETFIELYSKELELNDKDNDENDSSDDEYEKN